MRAKAAVILNSSAGSFGGDQQIDAIKKAFENVQIAATIESVTAGNSLESAILAAIGSDADLIVAAGGDGTVSAVAAEVIRSGKVLGVIPLGTLNHFSKDLNLPQDVNEAVRVIAEGDEMNADIAEVNGRSFINNSSIGLYPRIVRKRDKLQNRLGGGKWFAAAWAAWRLFWVSPFERVKLELDSDELLRKTPFVFVGNNEYEMDLFNIGHRSHLDQGKLSIYLLKRTGRMALLMLIVRTLFGTIGQARDFEQIFTSKLTVETRKRVTLVALDGEVAAMESPLEYRIHPHKLRVMVPRATE